MASDTPSATPTTNQHSEKDVNTIPTSPTTTAAFAQPVQATSENPTDSNSKPTRIDCKSVSTHSRPSHEREKENIAPSHAGEAGDCKIEHGEDIDTNNVPPSAETVAKIGQFTVLDQDGKSIPFQNLYSGPNVVRRVLVVFIRHFFCSICQEYVRNLSSNPALSPSALLSLPSPTFICIIGCGSPSLIPHYISQTSCPYPIYADPTRQLYTALNMVRNWRGGNKQPEYIEKSFVGLTVRSVVQIMKQVGKGNAIKHGEWGGGDFGQVGGEFLFEPADGMAYSPGGISPGETPESDISTPRGYLKGDDYLRAGARKRDEKIVTWCHRMRNTRDHTEIKDLMKILEIGKKEVIVERKLTGMSARSAAASLQNAEREAKGGQDMDTVR